MEALVLTLSLRMIRARVDNVDAELEQPDTEFGPSDLRASAPRHAVVDQERVGQAIALKRPFEVLLDRRALLIETGLQAQGIAGMIVDHGERVTHLSVAQSEASLEVHLPDVVRGLMLEAGVLRRLRRWRNAVMPAQNGVDCRCHRYALVLVF